MCRRQSYRSVSMPIPLSITTIYMYLQLLDSAVVNIDPSTLQFYGHTDGYDFKDGRAHDSISFKLQDGRPFEDVIAYLDKKYQLISTTPDMITPYKEENRIHIQLPSGYRGLANPSTFSFCSEEHAKWLLDKF